MSEESCVKITILKRIPFDGEGDTLFNRLQRVGLRGFEDVKIYGSASFKPLYLSSSQIPERLSTSQLRVYQDKLDRISQLHILFMKEGIDIYRLDAAYDFDATAAEGTVTRWTMIPPIVERVSIPLTSSRHYDYGLLLGDEVMAFLRSKGKGINPEIFEMDSSLVQGGEHLLINDGTHRIHSGFLRGNGIKVLEISGMVEGFPYYAAPQPYLFMKVEAVRSQNSIETKVHVVDSPVHKHLYRLFPLGGIFSGEVRPDARLEN